jgi:putative membrane protein
MAHRSLWKGLVAGALGGLAATYVMTQFQNGWSKLTSRNKPEETPQSHEDPSTVKAADKLYVAIKGEHLPDDKKELYGNLFHYGTGALTGITYGILSEFSPLARKGFGTAFGSALFVTADEIAVPLAGLSKSFKEYPLKVHLHAWASHLVFGSALEASRLTTRKALARATHERKSLKSRRRTQRAFAA